MLTLKSDQLDVLQQLVKLQRSPKKHAGTEAESAFHRWEYDAAGVLTLRTTDTRLSLMSKFKAEEAQTNWSAKMKYIKPQNPYPYITGAGWTVDRKDDVLIFRKQDLVNRTDCFVPFRCFDNTPPFPEPTLAQGGGGVEVDVHRLQVALSFVSKAAETSGARESEATDRATVCTIFQEGVAYGASKGIKWKAEAPQLPFNLSITTLDAGRLARWLNVVVNTQGKPSDSVLVEVAETFFDKKKYFRLRTIDGSFTAWVVSYEAAFQRGFVDKPASRPPLVILIAERKAFASGMYMLEAFGRKLAFRHSANFGDTLKAECVSEKPEVARTEFQVEHQPDGWKGDLEFHVSSKDILLAAEAFSSDRIVLTVRKDRLSISTIPVKGREAEQVAYLNATVTQTPGTPQPAGATA